MKRDPNHYKRIGAKGGANGNTGGFASYEVGSDGLTGRERASVAGAIGGQARVSTKGYRTTRKRPDQADAKSSKMEGQWQDQNSTVSSSTLKATKPSEKSDANSSNHAKPGLVDRLRRLGR